MAGVSLNFKNIDGSKKCAVSSPKIVSLEIGDESPGITSESVFQGIILHGQVYHNDVKNNSDLICGCDKQSDKNFLIHSLSSLPTSTCDCPSDKIKSTNDSDIDLDLLDLLNFADLGRSVESGAGNFNSKKTTSDGNMKTISNVEESGGLSDLLSSIAHDISRKDEAGSTFDCYERKNTHDCGIDLLDFDVKNECADFVSSNNSSLKAEGNLSDLLSSINIEDSEVTKVGISDSRNMCSSKVANKSDLEKEQPDADLSDILSSIVHNCEKDEGNSNFQYCVRKNTHDHDNFKNEFADSLSSSNSSLKAEGNLSDLLSSINIEDSEVNKALSFNSRNMCNSEVSNESVMKNESPVADLSDLLSSIDLGDSNDNEVVNSYSGNVCNKEVSKSKDESCLADILSSIDVDKSTSTILNSKPLSFGSSDFYFKATNGISNSLNDIICDVGSFSSSSNSCASSYNGKESDSSKDSLSKNNLLTDKVFEYDSGYSSFDSVHKEFSFFDYSTDNQFSFNTLFTKKSDASIGLKHSESKNANEEMSMSDLMTIVSPEFKNPVLPSLNKPEKLESNVNKNGSSMFDVMKCINSDDSHIISNNSVDCDEKLMNYDCVDGRISRDVQHEIETIHVYDDALLGKDDISINKSDFVNDDDTILNDDEQITFIDLRECIKSSEPQLNTTSPVEQHKSVENRSSECFSPNQVLFCCEEKSPLDSSEGRSNLFEFNKVVSSKKSTVNTKQTLFSKALACKPKKDKSLLQKVATIKNELLKNIIYRPVFIDCDVPQPKVESVLQSDRCILSNVGRRSFGLDAPCELQ